MINGYPTEEELHDRICRHLVWQNSSEAVALIWRGYLTALSEWGVIDVSVCTRLCGLLPDIGYKELHELCLDEPISQQRAQELENFIKLEPGGEKLHR
jgi:hypothetical protein